MSSVDILTSGQINELKIQVKKWERNFERNNGRKPNKDDIDKDEEIRKNYIIYWKMIKVLKKQETENSKNDPNKNQSKNDSSNVWNDSCKKPVQPKVGEQKNAFVCKSKTLNMMSNKLLKMELESKPSRLSYSLNRKNKARTNDEDNKFIRINSNQVSLLRRQTNETSIEDNFVNLITSQDQQVELVSYSSTNQARFTVDVVDAPSTLNLESKIKIEPDSKNTSTDAVDCIDDHMDTLNKDCEIISTEKEIKLEVNSIISKLNSNDGISSTQQIEQCDHIDQPNKQIMQPAYNNQQFNQESVFFDHQSQHNYNQTFASNFEFPVQQIESNEINKGNDQNFTYLVPIQHHQTHLSQQIDFQIDTFQQPHYTYERQMNDDQLPLSATYFDQMNKFQSNDDVDFGTLMPHLFENLNTASRDKFNNRALESSYTICSNYTSSDQSSHSDNQTKDQQFIDLTNSNSASQPDMNADFSPVKDIPAEKLTFSNVIEGFTNLESASSNLFPRLQNEQSGAIDKQNEFHVKNLPDVYDFTYQSDFSVEKEKNESKKMNVKNLTKEKSKRKKNPNKDLNFRRIDIKRKVYVRGHKKINVNRYKRNEWKKLQSENKCFRCGEKDHWAKNCTNVDQELKAIENEDYDELEEMESDRQIMTNSAQPLFSENQKDEMDIQLNKALRELGFRSFRSNQREVVERILLGRSCLMISSTGSGKSFCYQLPAFLYHKFKKYITLVVSPLISLMEDQMLCLPKSLKAVCLHSGLSETVKKTNLNQIQSGEAQILFLSPEYILTHLYELSLLPTIGFVCIDEAHCLSEWSNNFRPSYLQFFNVLKEQMKINTFLALTATANKTTTKHILRNIDMSFEHDVLGLTQVPDNLVLTISRDSDKDFALINLLKSERFFKLNSIIIYCGRRETTEKIATLIRIEMQKSKDSSIECEWSASAYHAGLTYQERKRIQKNFITGKLRVVVATIAFGMGINKSDVDGIIHFSLPKTIENYIQEIGRAGRNGESAQCHIFLDHDSSDLFEQQRHIYSNGIDKKNVKKLTSKLFKPCKCTKLRQFAEDSMNIDQDNELPMRRCSGHENAFTVKELTEELDIKEETLLTILIYLELNLKHINIKVMNKTNSTCVLSCYKGGSEQLENLAKKYPFVALPLAQFKKEKPTSEPQTILRFSYINVASMLGQTSRDVYRKLKALEWRNEQNRRIRSNVRVAFENLSFHVITPGDLSEQEIEYIDQMILNYTKSQEILEVKRLKQFYEILKESSQSKCTNKINANKSIRLKKVLNDYFDLKRERSNLPEEDDLDDVNNLEKIANQCVVLKNSNNSEDAEARRDIRDLINIHSDQYLNPRAITRILQGIASPKYPAEVWGKENRFWRKHIKMDFNLLFKLAHEEYVRIKCIN